MKSPLLLALMFLVACKTGSQTENVLPKSTSVENQNRLITSKELLGLRVVDSGRALLYLSGERAEHKQLQLYRLDLASKKETRLTHHDGDVISAEEYPTGAKVIYASSTDELKEKVQMDLWAEKKSGKPGSLVATPAELYISNRDGSAIKRITQYPGYDADPTVQRFGRYILFTSTRGGLRSIYRTSLGGGSTWRVSPDKVEAFSPKLSPDSTKLVWLQKSDSQTELKIGGADFQKPETLVSFSTKISGPSWSPSGKGLLFSAKAQGTDHWAIWEYDIENHCAHLLVDRPGLEEAEPALGPDLKTLYFLEHSNAIFAILRTEIKETGDCSKSVVF